MYSIVIVDDEKYVANALSSFISEHMTDYKVSAVFTDGFDALDYLLKNPSDVVITDIRMLRMSGLELSGLLRDNRIESNIIIISGYSDFEYAKEAMQYGVQSYILKPVDFDELKTCLNKLKDRLDRQYLSTMEATTQENAEHFIYGVVTGKYKTPKDVMDFTENSPLPFSLDSQQVQLVDLNVKDKAQNWSHGIDALETALKNVLRLKLSGFMVFQAFRKDWHFYFAFVSCNVHTSQDIGNITDDISELLGIRCIFHKICEAENILGFLKAVPRGLFKKPDDTVSDKELMVKKIKEYIDKNYMRDISREDVSALVYVSPSYMSRTFKSITGISYVDYLMQTRMNKALELIASNMKISDIAEKIGYRSRSAFLVNFRHFTSYTPMEYRRKVLRMEDDCDENSL